MKKNAIIFATVMLLLGSLTALDVSCSEKMLRDALQGGRWVNNKGIAFTFANDTLLYIDDIHSDGTEYAYRIEHGSVLVIREVNSPSDIPTEEETFDIVDVGSFSMCLSNDSERLIFFKE